MNYKSKLNSFHVPFIPTNPMLLSWSSTPHVRGCPTPTLTSLRTWDERTEYREELVGSLRRSTVPQKSSLRTAEICES